MLIANTSQEKKENGKRIVHAMRLEIRLWAHRDGQGVDRHRQIEPKKLWSVL
jgi:hypothetical protein